MNHQSDIGLIAIVVGENSRAHEALKRICAQYEALTAAAKGACFHYWNCGNLCNESKTAMVHLAQVCGFSDPASDGDIQAALRAAGIQIEDES